MVLDKSELVLYLSGGSSNSNVNASLGGGISLTPVSAAFSNDPNLQNLFPNTTKEQSLAGATRNRCLYLKNNSATDTAHEINVWKYSETPSNDTIKLYIKPGQTPSTTEPIIATENLDPYVDVEWHDWVSYTQVAAIVSPSQIPDLAPGQYIGIWIQNFIPLLTPTYSNNFVTLANRFRNY